jgi:hypothetical protein
VHSRVGRVLGAVAGIVAVGVLGGCGVEQPGSAAVLGDTSVPLAVVQSQIRPILDKLTPEQRAQGVGPDIARFVLSLELTRDLARKELAAQGLTVTDADVSAYIEQRGGAAALLQGQPFDESQLRLQIFNTVAAAKLATKIAPGLTVTADVLGSANRADAEAKARTLAAGGPAAEALFSDARVSQRGVALTAVGNAAEAATVAFGLPAGSVVAFQPDPQQATWNVVRIVNRSTTAARDAAAVAKLSQQELVGIGQRTLQPLADSLGVTVNPRFGAWDPISMSVVAADQSQGLIIRPAG